MGRSSSPLPSNSSSRLLIVRFRRWSISRLRAMVNSQVSNRAWPLYWAPAHQNPHPDFLEKVLGLLAIAG